MPRARRLAPVPTTCHNLLMTWPMGRWAYSWLMLTVLMVHPVWASGPDNSSPCASRCATRSSQSRLLASMFINDRPAFREWPATRMALLRFIQYCWNIIIEYMARFISP